MNPYEPLPTPLIIDLPIVDPDTIPEVDCGPMVDRPRPVEPEILEEIRAVARWRMKHGI